MLRPGETRRRTNAELYPVISVPGESIRFGTLSSCSLGPTPSSLALITERDTQPQAPAVVAANSPSLVTLSLVQHD